MKKILLGALAATAIFTTTTLNAQIEDQMPNKAPMTDINGTADDLENTGIVGISNWEAFNKLSARMYELEGASYYTTIKVINELKPIVAMLEPTKPMWMNTEEINEDIEDFKKEFNELTAQKTADSGEFRENLEEIVEQYEDLREEAHEVFMAYLENVQEGNDQWREALKNDMARQKKMKEGYKEYKEETEDNKDIRDGSKMKSNK
ncbi:MAG: hypothetical protein ABNH00_05710 [Dokdonia sp.]|jgi:DNA repair exonuclease SbcCD ATPase subunit|nr:hypothetical protein [Cytophagaceae bacterium]